MKKQQGVALVVVLSLLAGTAMIGMSGMQSAIVDERLSGNFRVVVRSFSDTETLAASLTNQQYRASMEDLLNAVLDGEADVSGQAFKLNSSDEASSLPANARTALEQIANKFRDEWKPINYAELTDEQKANVDERMDEMLGQLEIELNQTSDSTVEITTRDIGARGNARSESTLEFTRIFSSSADSSSSPFQSAIVGCQGVDISGGSSISSYRSSMGQWSGVHSLPSGDDFSLVQTTQDNADLSLGDNEQVYGNVAVNGMIALNGSSNILGDVLANGNAFLNAGGGGIQGNLDSLDDIVFQTSSRVGGRVRAEGNVAFQNFDASVGQGITAGGSITSSERDNPADHIDEAFRDSFYPDSSISINPVPTTDCDNFVFDGSTLTEEMSRYQSDLESQGEINVGVWPNVEWRFTPSSIERFDRSDEIDTWVEFSQPQENTFMGSSSSVYRISSLNLAESPTLHVEGGDVVLVVDGDFTSSGGGQGLNIADDSSLTLFVGGEVNLGSNVDMSDSLSISNSGRPTFSIFSSYESNKFDVNFTSSNRVVANVYAPFTGVSINSGADFLGSVRAREIEVSGDGDLVYDRDLADAFDYIPDEVPSTGEWCSFSELSPLTVVGTAGNLDLPSSNAEFNGNDVVPDITVAAGEGARYSYANAANENIHEGIPAGLFDSGNRAANFDNFISRVRSSATLIAGNHEVKGNARGNKKNPFGTAGDEEIWFIDGNLTGNNLNGAGVLVVNGNYNSSGNPSYDGLIIVLGNYSQGGGGGDDFNGALLVAPYSPASLTFTSPDINFNGGGSNNFLYDVGVLNTAFNLLDDDTKDAWDYCDEVDPPFPPDDDDDEDESDGEYRWDLTGWR
ncbi:hypothetical protein OR573_09055 [Halomonas sp. CH40]